MVKPNMIRDKRGFTLVELIIAMVLTGIVLGVFGSVFNHFLIVPARQSDHLTAINELSRALDIIQDDGVQANSFTALNVSCTTPEQPYYGNFSSGYFDPDSGNITTYTVKYKYDCVDGRLIREQSLDGTSTVIASHIAHAEDVVFTHAGNKVLVTMTVTLNSGADNEVSETGIRNIDMRAGQ